MFLTLKHTQNEYLTWRKVRLPWYNSEWK